MAIEPTIAMMNEAIARFMGYEQQEQDFRRPKNTLVFLIEKYWTPIHHLKYHTSWDWLMPVVKKILHEVDAINTEAKVREALYSCDLEAAHKASYQFITWLNQQKQNDGD